jgi:hypothetical protein
LLSNWKFPFQQCNVKKVSTFCLKCSEVSPAVFCAINVKLLLYFRCKCTSWHLSHTCWQCKNSWPDPLVEMLEIRIVYYTNRVRKLQWENCTTRWDFDYLGWFFPALTSHIEGAVSRAKEIFILNNPLVKKCVSTSVRTNVLHAVTLSLNALLNQRVKIGHFFGNETVNRIIFFHPIESDSNSNLKKNPFPIHPIYFEFVILFHLSAHLRFTMIFSRFWNIHKDFIAVCPEGCQHLRLWFEKKNGEYPLFFIDLFFVL